MQLQSRTNGRILPGKDVRFDQASPFLVVVPHVFVLCLRLRGDGIGRMVLSLLERR